MKNFMITVSLMLGGCWLDSLLGKTLTSDGDGDCIITTKTNGGQTSTSQSGDCKGKTNCVIISETNNGKSQSSKKEKCS